MMVRKFFVLLCAGMLWLAAAALPASAEWIVDVYGGISQTPNDDATAGISGVRAKETVRFDTSYTLGGRVGYWFEAHPWLGLAVDASFFKPEGDILVVPVSALLMLRCPLLESDDVPGGQLQPYVGVGPSVFIARTETGLSTRLPATFSATSIEPGLDVRAGLAWQFHRRIAVFVEYRFTHVGLKFESDVPGRGTTLDVPLNTSHGLLGVSYRF